MLVPAPGVVCSRGSQGLGPGAVDSYLIASGGKATWFDGAEEQNRWHPEAEGAMFAAISGEGDDDAAALTAATTVARVLIKRWVRPPPTEVAQALVSYLRKAHEQMYWKVRERRGALGASAALGWWLGDRVHWAEIGEARIYLCRDGSVHRVGQPWSEGERQRLLSGSAGLGDDVAVHFREGVNVGTVAWRPSDRFALLTAGAWEHVDDGTLRQLLLHVDDAQTAAVSMMDRAIARGSKSPVSVVVVDHPGAASSDPAPSAEAEEPAITMDDEGPLRLDAPPPRRGRSGHKE